MRMRQGRGRRLGRGWAGGWIGVCGAVVVVVGGCGRGEPAGDATLRLAPVMRIEEPVVQLANIFERTSVVSEDAAHPVHMARLQPGHRLRANAGPRTALVAPPPATVRLSTAVPPDAVLRFGIGVEGEQRTDGTAHGVQFTARVDGREVFKRVVNPAATRHDRRWFDVRIELGADTAREVQIELQTKATGAGTRIAGTPGWSHLRVVREIERGRQAASATAPNVLLLLVDTLRADHLGCYGAVPSPSPTLDRLAADGVLFEQAVAQSAWTMPSVASIFTGVHARSHGVVGVASDGHDGHDVSAGTAAAADPSYLPDSLRTIAEVAQAAGVTTFGVSSNPLVARASNLAKGFESFVEFGWEGGESAWPRAAEINSVFLDWLSLNRTHRFLGYLHYMDAHAPYQPPEGYRPVAPAHLRKAVARGEVGRIAEKLDDSTTGALSGPELAHLRSLYNAEIRYWDDQLAVLLDGLRAAGVADRTIVVVTADHGEAFLEHGRLKHGVHLYDELVRVPLVIGGPIARRGRVATQAQGIDLFPTIAGLLDVRAPAGLPGRNVLEGADRATERAWAISETRWGLAGDGGSTELVSIRTPAWKLIHQPETGHFELYDLLGDPAEQDDRFGEATEGDDLVRRLADWRQRTPPPPAARGHDPEFRDKLRALGYIE